MIFQRKSKQVRELSILEKRVAMIATNELVSWADQSLFAIGRGIGQYQKSNDPLDIHEARSAVDALSVVLAEIESRG